ncbi:MAG: hypothetical protein AAGG81_06335, partial [Chlamydiota bacterium]
MLDTANFFELHTSSNVDLKDQIMKDIRARYPSQKLFSQEMVINKDLFIKFREHINGMGIEVDPSENIPHNARVHIKVAYIVFPGVQFKEARETAIKLINNHFDKSGKQVRIDSTATNSHPQETPVVSSNQRPSMVSVSHNPTVSRTLSGRLPTHTNQGGNIQNPHSGALNSTVPQSGPPNTYNHQLYTQMSQPPPPPP